MEVNEGRHLLPTIGELSKNAVDVPIAHVSVQKNTIGLYWFIYVTVG